MKPERRFDASVGRTYSLDEYIQDCYGGLPNESMLEEQWKKHEIECTYAGFNIEVRAQETGGFYIQVHNPEISFGTAVDGYFDEWSREKPVRTVEDALVVALESII